MSPIPQSLRIVTRGRATGDALAFVTRGLLSSEILYLPGGVPPETAFPPGQMTDALLGVFQDLRAGDLAVEAGDLAPEHGLRTAVLLSLFSDRLAEPDDELPVTGDRRGFWGDLLAEPAGDRWGSRLWELARAKETRETQSLAREYAEEALAWLVADGIATSVEVAVEFPARGLMQLDCALRAPRLEGPLVLRFLYLWRES